jgi:transcription elongation factor GreA
MQVPHRRGEEETRTVFDPHMTQEKYDELAAKLQRLKHVTRFKWMTEVATLAEGGDFSENAGYQAAKSKLRGINQTILDIEFMLKKAIIIPPSTGTSVQLGSRVSVRSAEGEERSYEILGSSEVDPIRNVISHNSPLGSALMGKRVGESVQVENRKGTTVWTVMEIR